MSILLLEWGLSPLATQRCTCFPTWSRPRPHLLLGLGLGGRAWLAGPALRFPRGVAAAVRCLALGRLGCDRRGLLRHLSSQSGVGLLLPHSHLLSHSRMLASCPSLAPGMDGATLYRAGIHGCMTSGSTITKEMADGNKEVMASHPQNWAGWGSAGQPELPALSCSPHSYKTATG